VYKKNLVFGDMGASVAGKLCTFVKSWLNCVLVRGVEGVLAIKPMEADE